VCVHKFKAEVLNGVLKTVPFRVLVAHAYNPSYSEGRHQEDRGSKLALEKYFVRSYLEKPQHKKGQVEWLKQ
jgi:hypothetical protein